MARSWLLPFVALSLLLPGVLDLHVHPDGTCHAHPFVPEGDHEEDGEQPTPLGHRHSPSAPGCVRVLFPADAGITAAHIAVVAPVVAEQGPVATPADQRILRPFACGPPSPAAGPPLYLSLRHLLI
jgi:hypothetical protein